MNEELIEELYGRIWQLENEIIELENKSKMKEEKKMKMINPNILDEGNQMEILEEHLDEMETIVRCNNCGKPTKYGETRMCSGFVGCDNKIMVNGKETECYFGDLQPRVVKCHDNDDSTLYNLYKARKLYRWRDGADGGIENE